MIPIEFEYQALMRRILNARNFAVDLKKRDSSNPVEIISDLTNAFNNVADMLQMKRITNEPGRTE